MLLFLLLALSDTSAAADCSAFKTDAGNIEIPDNTECTLSSDLSVVDLIVHGTIKITSANPVNIYSQNIDIKAGAKIIADAVAENGPGVGNSYGSGGS